MSLILGKREERYFGINTVSDLIPRRMVGGRVPYVSADRAMKHSAFWAGIRLRSDLISTLPFKAYRNVQLEDGVYHKIDATLTPFMARPDFMEWRSSSQAELDRTGNSIGVIRGGPDVTSTQFYIELYPSSACSIFYERGNKKYRIDNQVYDPAEVWHEKQYTIPGLDVGLSPVSAAVFSLGLYESIEEFASDWFIGGATPRARLKNTAKKLNSKEATTVKESWRASRAADEPFVHGNDWEYSLIQAEQNASNWIDAMKLSLEDVARFVGVPADLIDAAAGGPNITYANVIQRNLQFLIMHIGPAVLRRENSLSQLLPKPRFVEMDSKALLRMDPKTLAAVIRTQIESRTLSPNEAREMDNRPPFTDDQIREFDELGLNRRGTTPATSLAPVPVNPADINAISDPAASTANSQGNLDG
ncbi:MAG TPA: phage portal protein [Geobacteraceae bacterium]|nr:phage portal protein [Geobacteraceae bacterium]